MGSTPQPSGLGLALLEAQAPKVLRRKPRIWQSTSGVEPGWNPLDKWGFGIGSMPVLDFGRGTACSNDLLGNFMFLTTPTPKDYKLSVVAACFSPLRIGRRAGTLGSALST